VELRGGFNVGGVGGVTRVEEIQVRYGRSGGSLALVGGGEGVGLWVARQWGGGLAPSGGEENTRKWWGGRWGESGGEVRHYSRVM